MVIHKTEETGASYRVNTIHAGAELGESWGGTGALTPVPQAHSALTGRSPGLMLPWLSPLSHARNAVQCTTEQVFA